MFNLSFVRGVRLLTIASLATIVRRVVPAWMLSVGGSVVISSAARAIGLANAVLLARLLKPADYGVYSYSLTLASALAVPAQFGIPTVVTREVAAGYGVKRWDLALGSIKWAYRGISAISAFVLAIASAALMLRSSALSEMQLWTLAIAMPLVPLLALDELRISVLAGLQRIVLSRPAGEVFRALFVLLGLLLITAADSALSFSATDAMVLTVAAAGSALVFGTVVLLRVRPVELTRANATYSVRDWNRSALPIALTTGIGFLNQSVAFLILGAFVASTDVGLYRVATLGAGMIITVLGTVNTALAPYFAVHAARGDSEMLQRFTTRSARTALLAALPLIMLYALAGKFFIQTLFGREYSSAYWPLVIISFGQLFTASTGSIGTILYMSNHERDATIGAAAGACVNIALSLVLVPGFGIDGAAYATTASEVVWGAVWAWYVWKRLAIIPGPFFRR